MQNIDQLEIKVYKTIPKNIASLVDRLLEENGSNNRIIGETAASEWSKERFVNKKDRYRFVVAFIDSNIVGIVIIWKRNIQYHEKPIVVGGLGGVGVQKEYRGKGIATKMLVIAREMLDQSDCDIAFLGTDVDDPQMLKMYGRIGYVPLKKSFCYEGRSGKLYEDSTSGMIAPIHSEKLYREILKDVEPFNIGIGTW